MLQPVIRANLSTQVFEQLRDGILAGRYVAGERLPSERKLCGLLGVNRSSVREAMRRLEEARLVQVRQGGSSIVLDFRLHAGFDLLRNLVIAGRLDPTVVRSVLEFRSLIGPELGRLAALRIRPPELVALTEIVARIEACPPADAAALQALDFEFYFALSRAGENLALILIYNTVREVFQEMASHFSPMFGAAPPASRNLYRKILLAIDRRDVAGAGRLCARQIEDANRRLRGEAEPPRRARTARVRR